MEEERQTYQAFVEASGAAMGSCSPETQGALLYTLQLLTGNVPLAALLGMLTTVQLWVMADEEPAPTAPSQDARDASTTNSTKCQHCSSDQDVPALR